MSRYTILIYPDGDAYSVVVPALPDCITWGRTLDEAVASASEAIAGYVELLRDTGQDVPTEERPPFVTTVDVEVVEKATA